MSDEQRNTGDRNTGYRNTGDRNTGDRNTGYRNTGDRNTGDWNTGNSNTGDCNTGYCNTGYWNTGDRNTGNWNTGYCNTGDRNTGYWNTGDRNTGNWNNCNFETGYFNTTQSDDVRIFNKSYPREKWESLDKPDFLYFNLTEWIRSEDMTDKEKEENPTHETTCGYLRKYEYKEAFKESWDEASKEDRKKVFNLPNFDADILLEISGIDVRKDDNSDKIKTLIEAQKELVEKAAEIQKQIEGLQKYHGA
jgi:hypothetical protein